MSANNENTPAGIGRDHGDQYRSDDLMDSPVMRRLIEAMESGTDVGDYGRLTFAIVARHFIPDSEMVRLLQDQPGFDEKAARALVLQVQERDYNPPKRERILEWQSRQEFQICPDPDDPTACNLYRELQFPDHIYEQIDDYWEEQVEAGEE